MSKYTSGPWKAKLNLGCKAIKGKDVSGYRVKEVACTSGLSNEEEDRANAASWYDK